MDDITVIVQETGSDVYIQVQEDFAPVLSVNIGTPDESTLYIII